jgi:hypothetical protein
MRHLTKDAQASQLGLRSWVDLEGCHRHTSMSSIWAAARKAFHLIAYLSLEPTNQCLQGVVALHNAWYDVLKPLGCTEKSRWIKSKDRLSPLWETSGTSAATTVAELLQIKQASPGRRSPAAVTSSPLLRSPAPHSSDTYCTGGTISISCAKERGNRCASRPCDP